MAQKKVTVLSTIICTFIFFTALTTAVQPNSVGGLAAGAHDQDREFFIHINNQHTFKLLRNILLSWGGHERWAKESASLSSREWITRDKQAIELAKLIEQFKEGDNGHVRDYDYQDNRKDSLAAEQKDLNVSTRAWYPGNGELRGFKIIVEDRFKVEDVLQAIDENPYVSFITPYHRKLRKQWVKNMGAFIKQEEAVDAAYNAGRWQGIIISLLSLIGFVLFFLVALRLRLFY